MKMKKTTKNLAFKINLPMIVGFENKKIAQNFGFQDQSDSYIHYS